MILGEHTLPPHCTVLINTWGLHRDPKQWKHPDEFYPEHFDSSRRHPYSFIPFSAGARSCAGNFYLNILKKPTLLIILQEKL